MNRTHWIVPDFQPANREEDAAESVNLVGLTRSGLQSRLIAAGTPDSQAGLRTRQLWQWIYQKGVRDFAKMSNIAGAYRRFLSDRFEIAVPRIVAKKVSSGGTRKYLLRLSDGQEIETVYIPEPGRGTLCVSSQVGCTLNCTFCYTGTQRLVRNLTSAEIIGQILVARDDLGEWPRPGRNPKIETRLLSNVVFMGMGEPLYNFDNVRDTINIAMDCEGISLSRRRITLSTAGVAPTIRRVGEEIGCRLAISLHATTDSVRDQLVPINRKWNIAALLEALKACPGISNSDRIVFEYVMLHEVNDTDEDARRLVELIRGIPAKVNLIPFNEWPGSAFRRSAPERIRAFATIIMNAGYSAPIRTTRGEEIMAACGQLKSASKRPRRRSTGSRGRPVADNWKGKPGYDCARR